MKNKQKKSKLLRDYHKNLKLALNYINFNCFTDAENNIVPLTDTESEVEIIDTCIETNCKEPIVCKELPCLAKSIEHPYVEIGGVKWATMNVGAVCEADYGLYFVWGDTQGYTASQVGRGEGRKPFYWGDYKWTNNEGSNFTKYTEDGLQTLEASDDAVHAAWGGNWRMPTAKEFIALGAATTSKWKCNYQGSGVNGLLVTDKTDSSKVLFFPACGDAKYGSVNAVGYRGYYWSSSLHTNCFEDYAYYLYFNSSYADWHDHYDRFKGFAVRGVLDV